MQKPKMILFDYGQTLIREGKYDGLKGTEAVMKYAVKNERNLTPAQVQAEADQANDEIGRYDFTKRHLFQIEVPNHIFSNYLYESLGIEIALEADELDRIFWDASSPGTAIEDVQAFLDYLQSEGIRTGVVSNISYSQNVVAERINRLIPGNHFEWILTTSNYVFRKPNRRIFDLALTKAGLKAEEVWYVGDHYECDIVGAKNAGLKPIWYQGAVEPSDEHPEIVRVKSYDELIQYMKTI